MIQVATYLKVRHKPNMPDRYDCYELLEQVYGATHPRATRWFLEALLVAGADDDEIAKYLGLPPWFTSAYHDLFYDVRPYREFEGMLISHALQRMDGFAAHDTIWKRIGLFCGADALRAFWGEGGSAAAAELLDRRLVNSLRRAALNSAEQRAQHVDPFYEGEAIGQYLARAATDKASNEMSGAGPLPALELRIVQKTTQAAEPVFIPEVSLVRRLQGGDRNQDASKTSGLDMTERDAHGSG